MVTTTSIIVFTPLAACLLTLLLSSLGLRGWCRLPAFFGCLAAAVASTVLILQVLDDPTPQTVATYSWLSIPGPFPLNIAFSFFVDRWAAWLAMSVTTIGGIAVFNAALDRSREQPVERMLAPMLLLIGSAVAVIFAGNFLQTVMGWGMLNISTYWLVGCDSSDLKSRNAVRKTMIVLQIGVCGLLLAIFLIWDSWGTLDISEVVAALSRPTLEQTTALPLIGAGLLVASLAMCAQFPLFVWLPDGADGPSAASALIQSVGPGAAGIHLLVRGQPLLEAVPGLLWLVAITGGVTVFVASYIGLTQTKLSRLFAFSTIGHFGLMFLALGTGTPQGVVAAGFHFTMHACGKSLMCLSGRGSSYDVPTDRVGFAIGGAATIGFPGLAGFWSIAAILAAVRNFHDGAGGTVPAIWWNGLFWVAVGSIFLGAFSLVRLSLRTESKGPGVSIGQRLGMLFLAVACVGLGAVVGCPTGWLSQWFGIDSSAITSSGWFVPIVCAAASSGGVLIAWALSVWGGKVPDRLARLLGPVVNFSRREMYLDALYFLGLALPLRAISLLCRFADWFFIDQIWVGLAGKLPLKLAESARSLQNGLAQFYLLIMVLAVGLLLMIALWAGARAW